MPRRVIRPVYVDGPLLGQRFDTDTAEVQAVDYDYSGAFPASHVVTYRFREFGFHAGGKAVVMWIGWCGEFPPDAEAIAVALLRPEVAERAEVRLV